MKNNIDAFDILSYCLKYKYQLRDSNPVATFEFILNKEQLNDLIECLQQMNIHHSFTDSKGVERKDFVRFNFLTCEVRINENFPI